jgi:L-lactate dehydrogenase complex protein LldG
MTNRDTILNRIRTRLVGDPPVERPSPAEIWPQTDPPIETMIRRFTAELQQVSEEAHRLTTMDEARRKLRELLDELSCTRLGVIDRPICRELVAGLPAERLAWPEPQWTAKDMADLDAGLVAADYLLADTGSCLIACTTPQERMMCYLPPASIVVARPGQLVEHLPAVWDQVASRAADPNLRGEFVIVTGPSRTADIEKILILGVHGPRRLIVLLVE